jgi:hypothetical protein
VDQVVLNTCVPVKCYENVLVIAETSQAEPGAFQLKYFAAGVGNIKTDWKGADETQEKLELTGIVQLDAQALAEARGEALKIEAHAFEVSADVYVQTTPAEYPEGTPAITVDVAATPKANESTGGVSEIVIYASDLGASALFELEFMDDSNSPGEKMIGLPNAGDELDPPPENDPHVVMKAQVLGGIPYRCWVHMKVGPPKGKSQANKFFVQISGAVDSAKKTVFKPGSNSYLTVQGPEQEGWTWVGCDLEGSDSLIYFEVNGEITIRLQAGMEGVGFDQFILSSEDYLAKPPSEAVVEK